MRRCRTLVSCVRSLLKKSCGSPSRHARESGHPDAIDFPGFRVALAIASLPGMTFELSNELQRHHSSITDLTLCSPSGECVASPFMVRPFEKPHGRLPRRPSVPSPSRNHHERGGFKHIAVRPEPFDSSVRPELRRRMNGWLRTDFVEGCTRIVTQSPGRG